MAKKKKPEKQNPIVYLVISLAIIAAVLIFSALLPEYKEEQQLEDAQYNGFSFLQESTGFWFANMEINDKPTSILFRHHPSEVDHIEVQNNTEEIIEYLSRRAVAGKETKLYITFDPHDPSMLGGYALASVEIGKILGEKFDIYNIPIEGAITSDYNETGAPIITCDDVTSRIGVIVFQSGSENKISVPTPNCIVMESTNSSNAVMVADRFAYTILGIIP